MHEYQKLPLYFQHCLRPDVFASPKNTLIGGRALRFGQITRSSIFILFSFEMFASINVIQTRFNYLH